MSDAGDRDLLAAEYVLGTLDADSAQEARRLLRDDPAFANAVHDWEARLTPLARTVPPVAPPPEVWDRIAAATQDAPQPAAPKPASPESATVVPLAWRRRLRLWQAGTAAALAIAASLAAFIVLRPAPAPLMAVLSAQGGHAPVLVATAASNGVLRVRPASSVSVPSGHDLELWALPPGAARPRPLGVLTAKGWRVAASLAPGTQLMVSLEPRGGSPTGQPTGPVLYGGRLTRVD